MWYYENQLFDTVLSEFDSFVYIIERLNVLEDSNSPIFYIGKKTFFNKSKHRGKRIIVESDWWDYYGSSEQLSADVERYGKDNFKRTILHLCRTKGDAGYLEAKEQIDRNVLHINESNYKLYYNKNILGNYRYEPSHYVINMKLQNYYNFDFIQGSKVKINNSKENRFVNKKIAEELVGSGNWFFGSCEKHIQVNDGVNNFTIPKSEFNEHIHTLGFLKEYVTDGHKYKLLLSDEIDDFIRDNDKWYRTEKKDITINVGENNKVSIIKNDELKWVSESEAKDYISKGWTLSSFDTDYPLYIVTNSISQKYFKTLEERDNFIKNSPDWRDGQIHRESLDKDFILAKDIRTDEKVSISRDEFKANKFLVTMGTKKVKIKRKNRIIFTGYLELFVMENPAYSLAKLKRAVRTETAEFEDLIISYLLL